jgi:hypothetical protein
MEKNIKDNKINAALRSLGFFFPMNEIELDNFNELYKDYDFELKGNEFTAQDIITSSDDIAKSFIGKKNKTDNSKLYFKRVVLAAEIASQLYNEPTFGHVKFQKMVYLCEQLANMKLPGRYSKQAAGPYDRKFMHTIDSEFKKQKWFKIEQEGIYKKFTYTPLENLSKYKVYYYRYFGKHDKMIQDIISKFKSEKTDFVELIATLFACWEEIISQDITISEEVIIKRFYDWSSEKSKFEISKVKEALNWMKEEGIKPN